MKVSDKDLMYLEALGRNGYSMLSASTWDDARPRLKQVWDSSGRAQRLPWEVIEILVHQAWLQAADSALRRSSGTG